MPKLQRNVERDLETTQALESLGWTVLRFWEHQDVVEIVASVDKAYRSYGDN